MTRSLLRWKAIVGPSAVAMVVGLVWLGCGQERTDLTAPADQFLRLQELAPAINVAARHTDRLLAIPGVVGTAVGLTADGRPAVKIFTREAGVAGLPESLEGVPVAVEVTGMIVALTAVTDPTARQPRPVPIGVSTGHPDITAGTIGARVKNSAGNVFILSNNHILANTNRGKIDEDNALQPGPFDGGSDPADAIGTLSDFEEIQFNPGKCNPSLGPADPDCNTIDAAIAISSTSMVGNTTPADDGYGTPSSTTVSAFVGQPVKKYGRTTKLTLGQVSELILAVDVCYEVRGPFCRRAARFVNQIGITPGSFSGGGDSGSLIVTQDGNNPVGLLFAGSSNRTIANPIDLVLARFNVTIDGGATAPPAPLTDIAVTGVTAPASALQGDVVSVDVTVENIGNQNVAANIPVALTDTPPAGGTAGTITDSPQTIFGGLAAGVSANLTFTWETSTASTGDHTLTASHGFVDENDANDANSATVTVNEPTAGTAPVVISCNPNNGARDTRPMVVVSGSNFQNGATVNFGQQVQVRDVTFVSATELNVQIRINKKAPPGPRDVTVTNPDGQSGMAACFTVN